MREVLEHYVDAQVGLNYDDVLKVRPVILASLSDDYFTIHPWDERDKRTIHIPMADIRTLIEAPADGHFTIGTGAAFEKTPVRPLIEISRPQYFKDRAWSFFVQVPLQREG